MATNSIKATANTSAKKPVMAAAKPLKPRRIKTGKYKSFKLSPRLKNHKKLASVWSITKTTGKLFYEHPKPLLGIALIYGIFSLIFVHGFSAGTNISELKGQLKSLITGGGAEAASSVAAFGVLLSSLGNGSGEAAGVYQTIFFVVFSLAVIFAIRRMVAGEAVRIKDAFYQGMHPLIPYALVLCAIGLQLLPLVAGGAAYGIVTSNGIAVTFAEKFLWIVVFGLMVLLTLYMLTSSLFALYIVALPGMTPMKALRSARELVRHRRWEVMRKILFLPFLLIIVAAVIMLPIIVLVPVIASWVFFVLSAVGLVAGHAYLYSLYRELL